MSIQVTRVAAYGLVTQDDEILLCRISEQFPAMTGRWTLPGGGIEWRENPVAAMIREVEEETGVKGLIIENFLMTTYHVFKQKGAYKLKEVHWFAMTTEYEGKLKGEKKEGIEKVKWKGPKKIQKALKKSYANIRILFEGN